MQLIPVHKIKVAEDRQRKENKSSKDLVDLKKSILEFGLMHPIVLSLHEDGTYWLVAGERRMLAMTELHLDGLAFKCNNEVVPADSFPFIFVDQLDLIALQEAELAENVLRANLSWQEEANARVKIHELREARNPGQTIKDTAQEIAATLNTNADTERKNLQMMKTVTAHMDSPVIAKSKSLRNAYTKSLDLQKARLERQLLAVAPKVSNHQVILGDCKAELKLLPSSSFDVILCDPPYGINVHQMKEEHVHNYDDSPKNALELYQVILREGFRLLKPQGHIFLFCDIEHFITVRTMAESQAFSTWRTPFTWHKGDDGFAPWGRNGFTRVSEWLMFASKGQRDLVLNPGPDVRTFKRVGKDSKVHGAEKPPELLRFLLQASTRPGDSVLDPCCGSGSIFVAARGLGVSVTGIELDSDAHAFASGRAIEDGAAPLSVLEHKKTVEEILDEIAP